MHQHLSQQAKSQMRGTPSAPEGPEPQTLTAGERAWAAAAVGEALAVSSKAEPGLPQIAQKSDA